jgi:glycosyltransferase involved in cell wall biosynthesis
VNIFHLYKDYYPGLGGIENYIKVLAEAHASAGHQVIVLVCDRGSRTRIEELNGIRVIRAGRLTTAASMPLSLAQTLALARLCPDVVHLHSPYPLGEAVNWLIGRGKVTVITHHSDVVRQKRILRFYGPILRRVLRAADRIIATSPRYIETSPWLRPVREKCVVVPLGVDVMRFTPAHQPHADPLALLFVGRLRYYKGLDTLLQALTHVPKARLTIVGEGPMREKWEALSRALGLADRVVFVGEVEDADLPGWYQQADLFVLPANARAEAFGTVLLEALACGVPVVSIPVGRAPELLPPEALFPVDNAMALVNRLQFWLADSQRLQAASHTARTLAEEQLSLEHFRERMRAEIAGSFTQVGDKI